MKRLARLPRLDFRFAVPVDATTDPRGGALMAVKYATGGAPVLARRPSTGRTSVATFARPASVAPHRPAAAAPGGP